MRRSRVLWSRLVVGVCFPLLALGLVACRDTRVVTDTYASLAEARAAGMISNGTLPDGLPDGTSDIRVARDPRTSARWSIFSFPPSEQDVVRALLEAQETPLEGLMMDVPGRIEWWPLVLRQELNGDQIHATGLEVYRTRDSARMVAVNWRQGRAYSWTIR